MANPQGKDENGPQAVEAVYSCSLRSSFWFWIFREPDLPKTEVPCYDRNHQVKRFTSLVNWIYVSAFCMKHVCYSLHSDALTSSLADLGGTNLTRASHFLETVNKWPVSTPFKCKPIYPEPLTSITAFIQCLHSGPSSTCPKHHRFRYWTTRDRLYAPEPIEMIWISQF